LVPPTVLFLPHRLFGAALVIVCVPPPPLQSLLQPHRSILPFRCSFPPRFHRLFVVVFLARGFFFALVSPAPLGFSVFGQQPAFFLRPGTFCFMSFSPWVFTSYALFLWLTPCCLRRFFFPFSSFCCSLSFLFSLSFGVYPFLLIHHNGSSCVLLTSRSFVSLFFNASQDSQFAPMVWRPATLFSLSPSVMFSFWGPEKLVLCPAVNITIRFVVCGPLSLFFGASLPFRGFLPHSSTVLSKLTLVCGVPVNSHPGPALVFFSGRSWVTLSPCALHSFFVPTTKNPWNPSS